MRTKTDMVRKDFYITKNQLKMVIKASNIEGITFSELMRRIMNDYLKKYEKENKNAI